MDPEWSCALPNMKTVSCCRGPAQRTEAAARLAAEALVGRAGQAHGEPRFREPQATRVPRTFLLCNEPVARGLGGVLNGDNLPFLRYVF